MEKEDRQEKNVKGVVVGDGAVGKTCFLISYTSKCFPMEYVPNIFDNYTTNLEVDGVWIRLGLWDTCALEEYDKLRPLSYPGADFFLLFFSVVNPSSFENVSKKWVPEILHYCPDANIILVGNKQDLRQDTATLEALSSTGEAPISEKQCLQMLNQIKAEKYVECSALTRTGLEEVIQQAIHIALHPPIKKSGGGCLLF